MLEVKSPRNFYFSRRSESRNNSIKHQQSIYKVCLSCISMISVVIPAFNEEKLLADCLSSLKNQDYQGQFEVIVVDNGSKDNTANIARQFGARVIPANKKTGVGYARQAGAEAAGGDIIAQADADSVYPRDWLQKIAEWFTSQPKVVGVSGRYTYREKFRWAKLELFVRHCVNTISAIVFGRPFMVSGATFAFRRTAFISVNGYRGLIYSVDQVGISGRLSRKGRVAYDGRLRILTSSRSVQKPTVVLIRDIFVNIHRLNMYYLNTMTHRKWEFRAKLLLKRFSNWLIPIPILIVSLLAYGYFIPASPVFGKIYSKAAAPGNTVALTFDDGPNEPYTSQVLDILKGSGIKATFFLIGENVKLYPDTANRILNEGHTIGNHSFSHQANHALSTFGSRDLQLAQEVIFNTTEVTPFLYRPPHGKKSPWELQSLKKDEMIEVTWSVAANDQHTLAYFGSQSASTFTRDIVSRTNPGDIILLHDGYGTQHNNAKSDKTLIVKALPLIIDQLKAKGYRFVTVPELLNVPAYKEGTP
jgi:peptidoglycan-N-acetylglucosamine deacetylase